MTAYARNMSELLAVEALQGQTFVGGLNRVRGETDPDLSVSQDCLDKALILKREDEGAEVGATTLLGGNHRRDR